MAKGESHVSDDGEIEAENGELHHARVADEFVDFDRNVDSACDQSEPLGPTAFAPQAVSFDEADGSVEHRGPGDHPEVGVGHATGGIDKDAWIVTSGVEMAVPDQALGEKLNVTSDQRQQAEPGNQHEHSLRRFE